MNIRRNTFFFGFFLVMLGLGFTQVADAQYMRSGKRWSPRLLRMDQEWYTSKEALEIADNILLYQSEAGAWPKNTNIAVKPVSEEYLQKVMSGGEANTIDNGATTTPMHYLALVIEAGGEEKYRQAFDRGLNYLLEAQYENGGWPQFYPLRERGYYSEITYNDNAMMNVMYLLRAVSRGESPYTFTTEAQRIQSEEAINKGLLCILKTQLRDADGNPTAWCAQYHQETLEPAWARAYEPPSLSGAESVNIVRYLMDIEEPSEEVIAAVEGAVAWFEKVQINGIRYRRGRNENGERDAWIESDPEAEPIWARFYELETNRPIFLGRDSKVHYALDEIERERRAGYGYYTNSPRELLYEDYPSWKSGLDKD